MGNCIASPAPLPSGGKRKSSGKKVKKTVKGTNKRPSSQMLDEVYGSPHRRNSRT